MDKPATHDISDWTDAPSHEARAVKGYDAWLAQDIAAGLADLNAGKTVPLAEMRKEFGLE